MLLKSADTVYFAVMTCIIYMYIYIKQKTNKLYIKKIIKFTHQEDRNKKWVLDDLFTQFVKTKRLH